MIYELSEQYYDRVRPIFAARKNHPIINSIIERNNPGRIYVDNIDEPKTALIWAKQEIFFLGGRADNAGFNSALQSFLTEKIAPEALELGDDCFQVEVIPDEAWRDIIESLLPDKLPKRYYRWAFDFHPERYRALPSWRDSVPAGFSVRRIDRELLPIIRESLSIDRENKALEEVSKFWRSFEEFMEKGIGFCVIKDDDNTVISCCLSVFAAGRDLEIGINTYSIEYEGKGFATLAARAFIDWCMEKGLTPHWSTESFRLGSIAIAEKLGFEKLRLIRCYYYLFEEYQNIIHTAYWYLREGESPKTAMELVSRASAIRPLSAADYYSLARGWALAGRRNEALTYLVRAVTGGFSDIEKLKNERDLKLFHGTEEWSSLLERLSVESPEN